MPELAGAVAAGRGRKGRKLQRGERCSRWLITDAVVVGQWSWQHMVMLVDKAELEEETSTTEEERRTRSAAERRRRGTRGERRDVCSIAAKRLLVQDKVSVVELMVGRLVMVAKSHS